MPKNIEHNLIFAPLFFVLFFIYFAVYSYLLQLNITVLHLVFIAMFSLSYLTLLNFINKHWWYFICHFSVAIILFFGLINFAYFKVFGNFISINFDNLNQVNSGMLYIFKDFYKLVPTILYLVSILFLLALILTAAIYLKIQKKNKIGNLLFQDTKINLFISKSLHPMRKALLALVIFILINFSIFNFLVYLQENPRHNWWKNSEKINDIGFLGDFYEQIFTPLLKTKAQEVALNINPNSNVATPENINNPKTYTLPTDSLKQTQYIYQTILPDLSNASSTATVPSLPKIKAKTNVLVIQLESVSQWALDNDPTPMPFLKSLIKNNISVENFHSDSCQTVNAEFISLCSIWPDSQGTINTTHLENDFSCLPENLKNFGYETYYFHSDLPNFYNRDVLLPKLSFDHIYMTPYFRQKEDDEFVFTHALDLLKESEKPFFAYVLSFTTHAPHDQELIDYNLEKNNLKITPWRNQLNPEYVKLLNEQKFLYEDQETIENYLGFLETTDQALKATFDQLKNLDMLDDTLVVIYNDHRFYNFFNDDFTGFQEYNTMPFVIVTPQKDQMQVQSIASQIDIAPTILHLLNQNTTETPKTFTGQSLFDPQFNNQVLNKCLDSIYYLNKDVLIEGSNKSKVYRVSQAFTEISNDAKKAWLSWVKKLVQISDQALDENKLVN